MVHQCISVKPMHGSFSKYCKARDEIHEALTFMSTTYYLKHTSCLKTVSGNNLEKQDRLRPSAKSKGQSSSCRDGETFHLWFTWCWLCLADGQLAPGRSGPPPASTEPPHWPFSTTSCTITAFVKADEEIMVWREQIGPSWLSLVSRMLTANCGLCQEECDFGMRGGMQKGGERDMAQFI